MRDKQKSSKPLNIALWTAQILLSIGFIWGGAASLFLPAGTLAGMWPWTAEHAILVKITGVLDLLAAAGLILPALLRIYPKLVVYAAYGIAVLMILASIFHIARGEASLIGVNVFFAVVALFIAWGRRKYAA